MPSHNVTTLTILQKGPIGRLDLMHFILRKLGNSGSSTYYHNILVILSPISGSSQKVKKNTNLDAAYSSGSSFHSLWPEMVACSLASVTNRKIDWHSRHTNILSNLPDFPKSEGNIAGACLPKFIAFMQLDHWRVNWCRRLTSVYRFCLFHQAAQDWNAASVSCSMCSVIRSANSKIHSLRT